MLTRRGFAARLGAGAAALPMLSEMAYAQRAAVQAAGMAKDMVWLNANENPAGIPRAALAAMNETLPSAWRYHYQEFRGIYEAIAKSEDLSPDQVLVGAGSSEVLHIAVDSLTSATRPLITVTPTYEGPVELARALGRKVILTKLRPDYSADVRQLVEEADRAHGGLIYICNPNNPTSSITTRQDLDWLVSNLPAQTTLLVDEAYIHFGVSPDLASALPYVRQGKDVIVTRTFSKIYGMAGMRVGFAAGRADWVTRMAPLRNNVVSIVSAKGVVAALADRKAIVSERQAAMDRTRRELCGWLKERKLAYIEPHANFIMIDTGRDARHFIGEMPKLGVAPGRPFPPLNQMLRVTIGTDAEMAKFREVFWKVHQS